MGGWRVAQSPMLSTKIAIDRLKTAAVSVWLGTIESSIIHEPLPKCREDPCVQWCERRTGGLWLTDDYSIAGSYFNPSSTAYLKSTSNSAISKFLVSLVDNSIELDSISVN
jgi:hypothetical protein